MKTDYAEKIGALSQEQRTFFYRHLSIHLTVGVRRICGHENWTDADKVEKLSRLNELQHRVASMPFWSGSNEEDWRHEEFARSLSFYIEEDQELFALVERWVEHSYSRVISLMGSKDRE